MIWKLAKIKKCKTSKFKIFIFKRVYLLCVVRTSLATPMRSSIRFYSSIIYSNTE
jgi:hypothetical protein